MKNFIFKSTDADLQKMFQQIETIQKNVLYVTHQVDVIRQRVISMGNQLDLQRQSDEYYIKNHKEPGTSYQTELDEQ